MAFVAVARLSELPPGTVGEVYVGGSPYAICNHGGEVRAIGGTCPHAHGPLGQGRLEDGYVVCPWHEWAFDCRTGGNDYNARFAVPVFAVKVEGGEIFLDAPDA